MMDEELVENLGNDHIVLESLSSVYGRHYATGCCSHESGKKKDQVIELEIEAMKVTKIMTEMK